MAYDVPRFLHLTNGKLYYVASEGGEDCVIRLNTQSGSREVLARAGVALKFALCDGVMYMLDANAALKERTLSGEESELMTGVSDFTLDAAGKALLVRDAGRRGRLRHPDGAERDASTPARRIRRRCAGRRCSCEPAGASSA